MLFSRYNLRRDTKHKEVIGMNCPKCNGETAGWKCAICGVEAGEHDTEHLHAGSDRYCTLKCKACNQADVQCTCS